MKNPVYDLVMILHVLSAVIGFGTLMVSGVYSANLQKSKDIFNSKQLKKYFTGKTNYMGNVLFLVPVFGAILLYMGKWHQLSHPYPWVGIACWTIGALVAGFIIFPQEKLIGVYINKNGQTGEDRSGISDGHSHEKFKQMSRKIERASSVAAVCFTLAVVFMVIQPSL